jgi:hypothetical protein
MLPLVHVALVERPTSLKTVLLRHRLETINACMLFCQNDDKLKCLRVMICVSMMTDDDDDDDDDDVVVRLDDFATMSCWSAPNLPRRPIRVLLLDERPPPTVQTLHEAASAKTRGRESATSSTGRRLHCLMPTTWSMEV